MVQAKKDIGESLLKGRIQRCSGIKLLISDLLWFWELTGNSGVDLACDFLRGRGHLDSVLSEGSEGLDIQDVLLIFLSGTSGLLSVSSLFRKVNWISYMEAQDPKRRKQKLASQLACVHNCHSATSSNFLWSQKSQDISWMLGAGGGLRASDPQMKEHQVPTEEKWMS